MNKATPELGLYFIAVIPPNPVYDDAQLWKEHFDNTYQSKAALKSPPHITLHMPFKCKPKKEQALIDSLSTIGNKNSSFELTIDGFNAFKPRVIFMKTIENSALNSLQAIITKTMKTAFNIFNADYRDRPFHPHLTLAFRDLKKDKFELAWNEFQSKQYQKSFFIDQYWLLKHDGKRWHPYQSFSLT